MIETIQFHSRTQGSFGEHEDWWYLVVLDDGTSHVEHEWSYVDAYRGGPGNSGQKTYAIQDFMNGDHESNAKQKLKALLEERGQV